MHVTCMLNSALGEALVVEAEPSLSLPSSTHRALGFGYMYRATAEAGQPSAAFFALGGCAGVGFLLSLGLR